MAFEVKRDTVVSSESGTAKYRVCVTAALEDVIDREMVRAVVHQIADKVADIYVAEHYQEIVAKIDQQAIANLSVAEAGVKIREALEKDIPGRVEHIIERKREVYQRGLLGGITRIL